MNNSDDKSWKFTRFLKLGGIIALVGYTPLQLYILFGPSDGNPIGLGLLFVMCMFAGFCVIAIGCVKALWSRIQ